MTVSGWFTKDWYMPLASSYCIFREGATIFFEDAEPFPDTVAALHVDSVQLVDGVEHVLCHGLEAAGLELVGRVLGNEELASALVLWYCGACEKRRGAVFFDVRIDMLPDAMRIGQLPRVVEPYWPGT